MTQKEAVEVFATQVFDVAEIFLDETPDREQILKIIQELFEVFQSVGPILGIENRAGFFSHLAQFILAEANARIGDLQLEDE